MKNQSNRKLLICFAASPAAYLAVFRTKVVGFSWSWQTGGQLLLCGHALPAFYFQVLLCRLFHSSLVRAIPLMPMGLAALLGTWLVLTADGWDALRGLLLLAGWIALAVGCWLGWPVYVSDRQSQAGKERAVL